MIILQFYNGDTKILNLPSPEKQKKLYDLWYEIINKKILLNIDNEKIEIKLSEISNCMFGKQSYNYLKNKDNKETNNQKYEDTLNSLKELFGFNK